MSKFCHNCGKQLPTINAKFCAYCGTSLASLTAVPQPVRGTTFTPFTVNREDDDEAVDHLEHLQLNINSLDFEIKTYKVPTETVGGVMSQGDGKTAPTPLSHREGESSSVDKVIQEFQKEAGSLRTP